MLVLDLVQAYSSSIGLLPTDQKTFVIRYLPMKTVNMFSVSVGFKDLIIYDTKIRKPLKTKESV